MRGIYRLAAAPELGRKARISGAPVRLVGSGSILVQVLAARDLLAERGVPAEVYSAPSFGELRRDALAVDRWNRLHPAEPARRPYVSDVLPPEGGPIVIATDWIRAYPDLVAPWLPAGRIVLGTDGFGRSDTRESLRCLFEIDPAHIAAAAAVGLSREGRMTPDEAAEIGTELGVDPDAVDPLAL
jgi:pyruvate dehydrogenase E1 component